jgi:hypothetical protein
VFKIEKIDFLTLKGNYLLFQQFMTTSKASTIYLSSASQKGKTINKPRRVGYLGP